jgi:diacylglycerol kinase family enzyme
VPQARSAEPIPAFVNPAAGRGEAAAEAVRGDRRFALHETAPSELATAVRAAVERGATRVLVAGGDGTIACAAGALADGTAELAVLAAGTLNHFARDCGLPTDFPEALEVAATGTARPVDAAFLNDRLFLNTSSVGAYVGFVRHRDHLEKWLPYRLASAASALRSLARLRSFHVLLDVEGESRSYRTALVFLGVGERELRFPSFGARKENGCSGLHVLALEGKARARLVALGIAAAAKGVRGVRSNPRFDSYVADECTIEMPRKLAWVAVDGEVMQMPAPLRYRLVRGAVRLVSPPPQAS